VWGKWQKTLAVAFAFIALAPRAAPAADCHKAGDTVTVTGTIHMRVAPPYKNSETKQRTYPVMAFDRPVCVTGGVLGDVPAGKIAAVMLMGVERKLTEGQHVSLEGQLAPRTDAHQAEELMLLIQDMAPDSPGPDETIISGASDAVAENCAKSAERLAKDLGSTIVNIRITRSPRYGTIWRADTSHFYPEIKKLIVTRTICWKGMEVLRPLSMFDPSKNTPPLQ